MAGTNAGIKEKVGGLINNVRYYWNEPPKGRYMTFKEIVSYAGGGIGCYFIILFGTQLSVSTTNMIVGGAIGIGPTDMYILYIISTLAGIPLTGIRANMVDNTRGRGGKYRPYLISIGIPTIICALAYVYFPYNSLETLVTGQIFGRDAYYVAKCAVVLVFNLLLSFFYSFFNDAYTNLIHVLSPNTQERTDVLAIKSVVYSLAPSISNIVLPIIAQVFANDDLYDINVYRIAYPIFAAVGAIGTVIVYANTQEKIVQAKTHTIQIGFWDALKEVAKNKYFWIISLAGWLGFLEGAYGNILTWSYTYGHTASGSEFALIQTLTGNASLWGMLLAPLCIRKWGKKKVLIGINILNVLFILAMGLNMDSIWWLFICVYFNWLVGAFEQITTPAIQADIRDYQQYKSGERIDGMFAAVTTIGGIITLFTSGVLPAVQEMYGIKDGNGYESPYDILDVTTGQPGLLHDMMLALIIMAAVGAFLNMVPYLFYDFTEKKQKSVIRVLQVRSLFEDYGNNALDNHQIVEAIDMVEEARKMAVAEPKTVSKDIYRQVKEEYRARLKSDTYNNALKEIKEKYFRDLQNATGDAQRKMLKKDYKAKISEYKTAAKKEYKEAYKAAKKEYRDALDFNEEIDISKFVCKELDKFDSDLFKHEIEVYQNIYDAGIEGIVDVSFADLRSDLAKAKALPKNTEEEKEFRKFEVELAKKKISAKKAFEKYYGSINDFVEPDMADLTAIFDEEDAIEKKIFDLVQQKSDAKKADNKEELIRIKAEIKDLNAQLKEIRKKEKSKMDEFAQFNRAAKPYIDARKLLLQKENYSHFEEIADLYDEAKINADAEDREKEELAALKRKEQEAELEARKAEKARKKALKSEKKSNKKNDK